MAEFSKKLRTMRRLGQNLLVVIKKGVLLCAAISTYKQKHVTANPGLHSCAASSKASYSRRKNELNEFVGMFLCS